MVLVRMCWTSRCVWDHVCVGGCGCVCVHRGVCPSATMSVTNKIDSWRVPSRALTHNLAARHNGTEPHLMMGRAHLHGRMYMQVRTVGPLDLRGQPRCMLRVAAVLYVGFSQVPKLRASTALKDATKVNPNPTPTLLGVKNVKYAVPLILILLLFMGLGISELGVKVHPSEPAEPWGSNLIPGDVPVLVPVKCPSFSVD